MATGKRFWTLAVVLGMCVLATAGCRRKSKRSTTLNTSGVFTTDDFPGASVQDNNVADDKRAFSASTDNYDGGLVCTHNGDRGTIMVTYDVDDQIFAHYYDGSTWSKGVVLRHWDTAIGTTDAGEIVHAFVNTGNDDRSDAADRDGDCLIFWNAQDFDTDGGAGADEPNQALYVSYFDVSHYTEGDLNFGFDIDPSDPGFYWAQRISSLEFSGEDVVFQGLVTDGLCGEARWQDGANVYSYGDDTTAIFVFWHELEEKSLGVFDDETTVSGFDLDFVVDEEFPLLGSADTELSIQTFGADDSGATCRESVVGDFYASYNSILFRRVRSNGAAALPNGFGGLLDSSYGYAFPSSAGEDVSLQYTHFNLGTFTFLTDSVNTVDPDSDGVDIDVLNADFIQSNLGFLGCTGQGIYGRDEGLSCLVTFFEQVYDSDYTVGGGIWVEEASESGLVIAEVDEDTGAFLNDAEPSILPADDLTIIDNGEPIATSTRISRNGDYIWVVWVQPNTVGSSNDYEFNTCQYLATRVDGDGLPVPVPPLSSSLGLPLFVQDDIEDGVTHAWMMWQDNLGYICGQQSDAAEMNIFFCTVDSTSSQDLVYRVILTADVDGTVGSETAAPPSLVVSEEVTGFHSSFFPVNEDRGTFNATDAGRDGDILYAFLYDDNDTDGLTDTYIAAGRSGVTAAAPVEVGSGIGQRHAAHPFWDDQELMLVATPAGTDIGAWNLDSSEYEASAHHGAEFVHVIFREAETASIPLTTPNTETGWALRTRTYSTDLSGGTFGDDFTPNAGTAFAKPFDIDLPFIDPDDFDDAEVMDVLVCDNTVVLIFTEAGHVYYQECNPGDGDADQPGWRQEAAGVSDPALVDDDTTELLSYFEGVCVRTCTCCTIEGAAIFWVKNLDDGSSIERLQARVINGGSN